MVNIVDRRKEGKGPILPGDSNLGTSTRARGVCRIDLPGNVSGPKLTTLFRAQQGYGMQF